MKPYILGVTGPTGSGKSTVSAWFSGHGFAVVDADVVARAVLTPPNPLLAELAAAFGTDILRPDGSLDRRRLSSRAFARREAAVLLSSITHPAILERMDGEIGRLRADGFDRILIDAPLLFESGADSRCDATVAVIAPRSMRLHRIMARDGITEAEAQKRMETQHPDEYYRARADFTIQNSGDASALAAAAKGIYIKLFEGVRS